MMHIYFLDTMHFMYSQTYYFSFGTLQIFSNTPLQGSENILFYSSGNKTALKSSTNLSDAKNWFNNILGSTGYLSVEADGRVILDIPNCSKWKKDGNLTTSSIDVWVYEGDETAVLNLYDRLAPSASLVPTPSASAAAGDSPAAQTEGAVISSDLSSQLDVISSSIGSLNLSVALLLFVLIFRSVISLR